jgi:hypothetical protein
MTHYSSDWNAGKSVVNEYSVTNIPRNTDTTAVVIYELGSPIQIGTSQKHYINPGYSNPEGGSTIRAFDVITPVAGTDYIFTENQDGTGTVLTANLLLVFQPYANNALMGFFNRGQPGYLVKAQIRGKGIYRYNPIEQITENLESKEDFVRTEISESLTREYSGDLNTSKQFANSAVALHRHPSLDLLSVSYHANSHEAHLLAFMFLEQGDKVSISEIFPEHEGDYYIQAVKFRIEMGGTIDFTWHLKEAVETFCQPIIVKAGTIGKVDAIDFGILPYLANLSHFSYSFWVRLNTALGGYYPLSRTVDPGDGTGRRGNKVLINKDQKIYFYSYKTPTDGEWVTSSVVLSNLNQWYHVVVTYDNTTDTADPKIYINGTLVAITESTTPVGTSDNDSDCPLILFNDSFQPTVPTLEYATSADNFHLKDVRIYNRILTQAEITALFNGEDDYSTVQNGLLFNGIFAPNSNIADYVGTTIEADDLVLDSVRQAAGVPYNQDTSNPAYMLTGESI